MLLHGLVIGCPHLMASVRWPTGRALSIVRPLTRQ